MAQDVPRILKEELRAKLEDPKVEVMDVRQPKDLDQSDQKIQGARFRNPNETEKWMGQLGRDKTYVLYCA